MSFKVLPDLVTPDIMLERLSGDFLEDSDDVENRDAVEKYMKDLSQMMDGMLDLNRRWVRLIHAYIYYIHQCKLIPSYSL